MSRSHSTGAPAAELPDRLATLVAGRPSRRSEYARILALLRAERGACRLPTLARRLTDTTAAEPPAAMRATYLRLRRDHVPTLVALGVVAYDDEHGTVTLLE